MNFIRILLILISFTGMAQQDSLKNVYWGFGIEVGTFLYSESNFKEKAIESINTYENVVSEKTLFAVHGYSIELKAVGRKNIFEFNKKNSLSIDVEAGLVGNISQLVHTSMTDSTYGMELRDGGAYANGWGFSAPVYLTYNIGFLSTAKSSNKGIGGFFGVGIEQTHDLFFLSDINIHYVGASQFIPSLKLGARAYNVMNNRLYGVHSEYEYPYNFHLKLGLGPRYEQIDYDFQGLFNTNRHIFVSVGINFSLSHKR